MKKRTNNIRKLGLKKQTVVKLNEGQMNIVNGGMEDGPRLPATLSTILCGFRTSIR